MKKFLNLFFILTIFTLSFAHFVAPAQGALGISNTLACHCDSMKELQKLSEAQSRETYMIDCATADTQTREHNGQARTAIASAFAATTTFTMISHIPAQVYNLHNTSISTDTPPPRYSA